MAAPNIANTSNIVGKLNTVEIDSVPTTIVINPASSGTAYKLNTLYASNTTGTLPVDMHLTVVRSSGAEFPILRYTTVPAEATLVVISKDNPIWLEEGDSINAQTGASGRLVAFCSYEIIS